MNRGQTTLAKTEMPFGPTMSRGMMSRYTVYPTTSQKA